MRLSNDYQKKHSVFYPYLLKRYFRQRWQFICGICRSSYKNPSQAHECLTACLNEFSKLQKVIVYRSATKILYKCRICRRSHSNFEKAKICSDACKQELQKKQEKMIRLTPLWLRPDIFYQAKPLAAILGALSDLKFNAPGIEFIEPEEFDVKPQQPDPHSFKTSVEGNAVFIEDKAGNSSSTNTNESVEQQDDKHLKPTTISTGEDDIAVNYNYTSMPVNQLKPESMASLNDLEKELENVSLDGISFDDNFGATSSTDKGAIKVYETEKFKRMGVKYVCKNCNQTYFTQTQSEQCFDKHQTNEKKAA